MIDLAKKFIKNTRSLNTTIQKLYTKLPSKIKYPEIFWYWYALLEESSYWDENKIKEYQLSQIKSLLKHAYDNTKYYRNLFDELGIKPEYIQDFEDYKKVPYSSRHIFMENLDLLVDENININSFEKIRTSGSTANPLVFYRHSDYAYMELAFTYHIWRQAGFSPDSKRIQIRGDILQTNRPFEYSGLHNSLRLSPGQISKDTATQYIKLIKSYNSQFIHGYPSAIAVLARVIKEHHILVPFNIKAIFLSSEALYQWQRDIIEEVFNSKVYCLYGNTEQVAIAGECKNFNYHFEPLYSYVELDDDTNEIIGTSFINKVNPFIRHRTKDIVIKTERECLCDHNGLVINKVEGRQGDYLVNFEGEYISPTSATYIFVGIETIKESKIIQYSDMSIEIQIMPYEKIRQQLIDDDILKITERLNNLMKGRVNINFIVRDSIELGNRGKFRWISSEVSAGMLDKD